MLRGNLLAFFAIQVVQIGLGDLARAALVDVLVDDRDRRFRENADRRDDDFELVGAEIP
jgi:hypothetical protein